MSVWASPFSPYTFYKFNSYRIVFLAKWKRTLSACLESVIHSCLSWLLMITEWKRLQRRNPEGVPALRWWLHGKNLVQKSQESGQGAGRKPHRWRAAGTALPQCLGVLPVIWVWLHFCLHKKIITNMNSLMHLSAVTCTCCGYCWCSCLLLTPAKALLMQGSFHMKSFWKEFLPDFSDSGDLFRWV